MSDNHDADPEEEHDSSDPLTHFRAHNNSETDLLPAQSPSVCGIVRCSFSHPSGTDVDISLSTDAAPGCGGVAWPAGKVLAAYLVSRGADFVKNKTIVELGSGTGLVGLVAAALGGRVWITDQAPLLALMRQNTVMNRLEESVIIEKLNWGSSIPNSIVHADLILAADCVYLESAFEPLARTLMDLMVDGTTEALFCYKKRRKADKRFFSQLRPHFTWVQVSDDPRSDAYSREGISLLRLRRRVKS